MWCLIPDQNLCSDRPVLPWLQWFENKNLSQHSHNSMCTLHTFMYIVLPRYRLAIRKSSNHMIMYICTTGTKSYSYTPINGTATTNSCDFTRAWIAGRLLMKQFVSGTRYLGSMYTSSEALLMASLIRVWRWEDTWVKVVGGQHIFYLSSAQNNSVSAHLHILNGVVMRLHLLGKLVPLFLRK